VKVASIAEAKAKLSDTIERCRRETVVFTSTGIPRSLGATRERTMTQSDFFSREPTLPASPRGSERSGRRVPLAEADRSTRTRGPTKGRRDLPTRGRSVKRSRSGASRPPIETGGRGSLRDRSAFHRDFPRPER